MNCGKDNRNENQFCSTCGGTNFEAPYSTDEPASATGQIQQPPVKPEQPVPVMPPPMPARKPFNFFDVMTILGFVSSIVGMWVVGFILEPIGVIASLLGFFKGTRYKGLAAAGIVIAIIAFIIRLIMVLYDNNVIGRWAVDGLLNYRH